MTATPFTLVSAEDRSKIFAYGLDIDLPSGRDVITFRRDANGHSMFGTHRSAEAARNRYSIITPLELVWEPTPHHRPCTGNREPDDTGSNELDPGN